MNWSDRISNEEVLAMVNESRCLIESIRRRKKKLDRTCTEREWTVEGCARKKIVLGKARVGRQRENAG